MTISIPPEPRLVKELDFKVIKEEWLTIKLKDNSIIKFKPILMRVFETDAKDPSRDEPMLAVEGQNILSVRSPEDQRGKPSEHIPPSPEALKMPKEEVEVIETTDPSWNLYELESGKRIKTKNVITNIYKIKDVFDRYGNPYYVVMSQMVIGSSQLRFQPPELSTESIGKIYPPLPRFENTLPSGILTYPTPLPNYKGRVHLFVKVREGVIGVYEVIEEVEAKLKDLAVGVHEDIKIFTPNLYLEPQEEGGFVAFSREFAEAVGQGETIEEALKDLEEAVQLLKEVLEEDKALEEERNR